MGNNNDKTPKDILIITFYDKFQNIKIARDLHHMILICWLVFKIWKQAPLQYFLWHTVGSSDLGIIKKGGVELIINEPLLIKIYPS